MKSIYAQELTSRYGAMLTPLERRLRTRALAFVVGRVVAEATDETRSVRKELASLAAVVASSTARWQELRVRSARLVIAYERAPSEEARRQALVAHLRADATEARQLRGDLRAMGRWLDVEALEERLAARAADALDDALTAAHLMRAIVDEERVGSTLAGALRDDGVVQVLVDSTDADRPDELRTAAVRCLTALMLRLPPMERAAFLGVQILREAQHLARGRGSRRWLRTAAIELLAAVLELRQMLVLIQALLHPDDDPDGAIVRAAALVTLARLDETAVAESPGWLRRSGRWPAVDAEGARRGAAKDGAWLKRSGRWPQVAPGSMSGDGGRASSPGIALARTGDSVSLRTTVLQTLQMARDDPSEHVRQTLARALRKRGESEELYEMVLGEASERVAAVALEQLCAIAVETRRSRERAVGALRFALSPGQPALLVRMALAAIARLCTGPLPVIEPTRFVADLERSLHEGCPLPLARPLAYTLRLLQVHADLPSRELLGRLQGTLGSLREGRRARLDLPPGVSDAQLELVLTVAAADDLTLSLRRRGDRLWLSRGEPRGWRLWRALHELTHPRPDKRRAYPHSQARLHRGDTLVTPANMAEVTGTGVPGERVHHEALGGWGAFLPRVDDVLAVATLRPRTVTLLNAFGRITLKSPPRLGRRLWLRVWLSLRYGELCRARERALLATSQQGRLQYVRRLAGLGLDVGFEVGQGDVAGTRYRASHPVVSGYYAALLLAVWTPPWVEPFIAYLVSWKGNTVWHLAIVAWLLVAALLLRALWVQRSTAAAKAAVPLRIGGWGTRGKSGTERLKAALFHSLRYDVVVKTTGCEAMMIHAQRDLPASELFIYRPYDKATIWEQLRVLEAARRLEAQVFLWECMALQPRYVDTLSQEWMKDELATITNTYPDHEDVQGPTGEDVARTIARFIPERGLTVTTERQMLPVLREVAAERRARLLEVDALEAELLPADLLARFPYDEHPENIALVLALAEHLGVERSWALVEMADRVVMDIGVLKTYRTVAYRSRRLTFSNGMSANERAGFLSNWRRLGFDVRRPRVLPLEVTVAVVNNRADRPARSRVFARIFAEDVVADHIVLINENVRGMRRAIGAALAAWLEGQSVAGDGVNDAVMPAFRERIERLGVALEHDTLKARVAAMIEAALPPASAWDLDAPIAEDLALDEALGGADADGVEARVRSLLAGAAADPAIAETVLHARREVSRTARARLAEQAVREACEAGDAVAADAAFRAVAHALVMDRISALDAPRATGDQVLDFVARQVAPGHHARIMGCQNIKGAGLDFAYRWVSIDRVHTHIDRLADPAWARDALTFLRGYRDYGVVDVRDALEAVLRMEARALGGPDAELRQSVVARLRRVQAERVRKLSGPLERGWAERAALVLEQGVDHLDAIARGRRARRILDDLVRRRVGHGRAAMLLRDVTLRQKGGWLYRALRARLPGQRPLEPR